MENEEIYDIIVVGLGGMGSSILYSLAKKGHKVLGVDQFDIPNKYGSSHGESRITRKAYFDGEIYLELIEEAYKIWEELEKASKEKLYLQTGGLFIGKENHSIYKGVLENFKQTGYKHEIFSKSEIEAKFPLFNIPDDYKGIYDYQAGILFPEKCIKAFIKEALKHTKVSVEVNCEVTFIERESVTDTFVIYTKKGKCYVTKKLVLACGSYINPLLKKSFNREIPVKIERNIVNYFFYKDGRSFGDLPIYIGSDSDQTTQFYGFPDIGYGFKVAIHHSNKIYESPDRIDRSISKQEEERIDDLLRKFIRNYTDGKAVINSRETCLYTRAPDDHFIIDKFIYKDLIVVSPCSGHGFKFASAVGRYVQELIDKGRFIKEFSLSRFNNQLVSKF